MLTDNLPIYIRSLMLKDYKCFGGEKTFWFCKDEKTTKLTQCTVILGDNGTGKTNILKAIANLEPILDDVKNVEASTESSTDEIAGFFLELAVSVGDKPISPDFSKSKMCKPRVIERHNCQIQYDIECGFFKTTVLRESINKSSFKSLIRYTTKHAQAPGDMWISEAPTKFGYTQRINYVEPNLDLLSVKIDAYGTNRHSKIGSKRIENQLNSESLFFDDNRLIDIESWIMQLDTARNHKRPGASKKYERVRNLIRHSSLFSDVRDIEIGFDENQNSFVLFVTNNGKYRLSELGYGYQCMFSWIFDFCKKMSDRYPKSDNPFHEPAILLVDEIDMHLHPSWQRVILAELCKMFPMTQFIVTTHSPLLVQSMEKINLYVLSRKNEGINISHYPDTSFQGWTVEEILRELMQLGSDIRSDRYTELIEQLQKSLQRGDEKKANSIFEELKNILHPNSIDRELIEMQIEGIGDNKYD